MRYVATVAGEEYVVTVEQPGEITVQGTSRGVRTERIDGEALFSLFVDEKPYEVFAERRDDTYYVTIEGMRYEVRVQDERLWELGEGRGGAGDEVGEATLRSPMPGTVVDVLVEEGQIVKAGDGVAILEAMKMENEIQAPCGGVVERVHVTPGQTVNLKDIIARIGAPERERPEESALRAEGRGDRSSEG